MFKELGLTTTPATGSGFLFGAPILSITKTMADLRPILNSNFDENQPPSPENPLFLTINECTSNTDTDVKNILCDEHLVGKDKYAFGIM